MFPTAPEFVLTAHHIEIRDFNCFMSDILTLGSYTEEAKVGKIWGMNQAIAHPIWSGTVRRTREEQRKIIDEAMDRTLLSSVFEELPRPTEVGIHFRLTVKGQKCSSCTLASPE